MSGKLKNREREREKSGGELMEVGEDIEKEEERSRERDGEREKERGKEKGKKELTVVTAIIFKKKKELEPNTSCPSVLISLSPGKLGIVSLMSDTAYTRLNWTKSSGPHPIGYIPTGTGSILNHAPNKNKKSRGIIISTQDSTLISISKKKRLLHIQL